LIETPTRFGEPGQQLFGIAATPDNPGNKRIGVILSGPGLHYRGYYFRMAVNLSRVLAENGYFSFRYDPYGVGDSEGNFDTNLFTYYFNQVEKGMFVPSHVAATKYFKESCKLDEIYTVGLCGGGITSVIAAAQTDLYAGVVSGSAPVWIHNPSIAPEERTLYREHARSEMMRYRQALFSWESVKKLITFKADFKRIFKVLKSMISSEATKPQVDEASSEMGLNRFFIDAFWKISEKKIPIAVILAEYDAVTTEYNKRFAEPNKTRLDELKDIYYVKTVAQANHKYSDTGSQEDLVDEIMSWLNNKTGRTGANVSVQSST